LHSSTARRRAHRGNHTAQGIGEEHVRAAAIRLTDQVPTQAVVVGVALVDPCTAIQVLFAAKGVDGQCGGASSG